MLSSAYSTNSPGDKCSGASNFGGDPRSTAGREQKPMKCGLSGELLLWATGPTYQPGTSAVGAAESPTQGRGSWDICPPVLMCHCQGHSWEVVWTPPALPACPSQTADKKETCARGTSGEDRTSVGWTLTARAPVSASLIASCRLTDIIHVKSLIRGPSHTKRSVV